MTTYPQVPQGYWPLFDQIAQLIATNQPILVAIDGRCGSGKTQLAKLLSAQFTCNVIPMDDFYLPFSARTPERMSSPGGHIDRERLELQMLRPLSQGQAVTLTPYDCHSGQPGERRPLPYRPLTLLEGSYSHHPSLRPFVTLSVFLTCNPQVQEIRLTARQADKGGFEPFRTRWIPLEETYFAHYAVESHSDVVLDTSDFFS